MPKPYHFAVILSGCGFMDGSEIHEAVMTLLAIDQHGGIYDCFAPNIPQTRVINHLTQQSSAETRNVLVESARIARGAIRDIKDYKPENYDALIFPGGFGAAANLSNFATAGEAYEINDDVTQSIQATYKAGKPIGALCIAPTLLPKLIKNPTLTVGQDKNVAAILEKLGAHLKPTNNGEIVIDKANRLVTTPCYMLDARISDIAKGADNLVKAIIEMLGN